MHPGQGNEIWLKDKPLMAVGITGGEQQIHQAKQIVGRVVNPNRLETRTLRHIVCHMQPNKMS